ncbi:hypothetical protein QK290_11330 [Pseudarthrobacter sp. AL07]|uniref:hypothetical protein n=1 Tax=unclassified Pseudarthrobacter TaxID=2647000 RepID=UPI00249C22C4|nr:MULTISPECIES: hypothetical protein [unclassified Pseudarthrobacter]MDI3195039.1 hypothetical protein [Pseudarthrobacter sp. AL20]MDI3209089.1 hypothetical protein [Pseudarthrobacter sp. AL07]
MKTLTLQKILPLALVVIAALAAILIWQGTLGAPTPSAQPSSTAPAATVLPVTKNPIATTGTAPGLTISKAKAEDNTDPQTNAAIPDRLQFTLSNSTPAPISSIEVYYTMTDSATGQTESYYQKLDGLTLAPDTSATVYFDNGNGPGHYTENKYSLYRTSTNEVKISVEAAAPGLAPATATATKAKGTGEKLD